MSYQVPPTRTFSGISHISGPYDWYEIYDEYERIPSSSNDADEAIVIHTSAVAWWVIRLPTKINFVGSSLTESAYILLGLFLRKN